MAILVALDWLLMVFKTEMVSKCYIAEVLFEMLGFVKVYRFTG